MYGPPVSMQITLRHIGAPRVGLRIAPALGHDQNRNIDMMAVMLTCVAISRKIHSKSLVGRCTIQISRAWGLIASIAVG